MKDSRISWTDHTYNPWIGCTKVSPGCERCYAERQAPRHGVEWGPHGERRRAAPSTLRQPFDWSRQAAKARRPAFVFCASLADVFDNKADPAWRAELFETIRGTPWLVWLLLTKRPQNIRAMLPPDWGEGYSNVWLGVSVENQEEAERRVPVLLEVPARLRFVSAEPLLEEVTLAPWLGRGRLEWVICGAESGPGRRPFERDWARRLRDECGAAGVCFFYKQEIAVDGKKIETPLLDGRRWTDRPEPELPIASDPPLLAEPASVATDGLAERINAAVARAQEAGREAVTRAVEAGVLLLEAKKAVGHGGWGDWLERHCRMAERTARAYMRLARELPKLPEEKRQRVADLSLRDAMAAVADDTRKVAQLPAPVAEDVLAAAPETGLHAPLARAVSAHGRAADQPGGRTAEWTPDQLERRARAEAGETVYCNMHDGVDEALRAWADETGRFVRADRKSVWGNPFVEGEDGDHDEVIRKYAEHWLPHKTGLQRRLPELDGGKVLGCWDYPDSCHCEVLIEALAAARAAAPATADPDAEEAEPAPAPVAAATPAERRQRSPEELVAFTAELKAMTAQLVASDEPEPPGRRRRKPVASEAAGAAVKRLPLVEPVELPPPPSGKRPKRKKDKAA